MLGVAVTIGRMEPQPPGRQAPEAPWPQGSSIPWQQGVSPFDPPPPYAPPPPEEEDEQPPKLSRTVLAAAAGGIALLIFVLWAVGGLRAQPKEPEAEPGDPIDQGRFTVTIRDARIATVEKKRYIVVRMHVINNGNETAVLASSDGLAGGLGGLTKLHTYVPPDEVDGMSAGGEVLNVQPGIPVEAAARWDLGASQPPQRFTIGLRSWSWHGGFSDATLRWWVDKDSGSALKATVPLQVAPQ